MKDGHVGAAEQGKIRHAENVQSRHVYHRKHNVAAN